MPDMLSLGGVAQGIGGKERLRVPRSGGEASHEMPVGHSRSGGRRSWRKRRREEKVAWEVAEGTAEALTPVKRQWNILKS